MLRVAKASLHLASSQPKAPGSPCSTWKRARRPRPPRRSERPGCCPWPATSPTPPVSRRQSRRPSRIGQIDVLYNNAGTNFRRPGPWDETQDGPTIDVTEELFDRSIGVNLKGPFLMSKYVLLHMVARKQGSIINVSSLAGPYIGAKNNVYAAAKAGVVGLTKALAQTYGPDGIRVNAIAPGLIETSMVANMLSDDSVREGYAQGTPLRKLGQPEDIARVALFLASSDWNSSPEPSSPPTRATWCADPLPRPAARTCRRRERIHSGLV